jgi:hypothetical protein
MVDLMGIQWVVLMEMKMVVVMVDLMVDCLAAEMVLWMVPW